MKITAELSLYPLQKKYKKPIKAFIRKLKKRTGIEVYTTAMSTYVTGSYDDVMTSLQEELKKVYKELPHSATVIKLIPQELAVKKGFIEI